MSGLGRSPWWIAVAAIVVFLAPAGFGQSARSSSANWASVASFASVIPTTLALQPATVVFSEPLKYGNEDHKKRKKDGGGGVTVPEGGSPVVYLGLAGFACLAAIFFSRRRSKLAERPTA